MPPMDAIGPRQLVVLLASATLVAIGYLGLTGSITLRPVLFAGILIAVALLSFVAGQRRDPIVRQQT